MWREEFESYGKQYLFLAGEGAAKSGEICSVPDSNSYL